MKLVAASAVSSALGLGSITLIDNAVTAALHTATEEVKAATLADYDEGTYTDVFFIHAMFRAGDSYRATLALRHGFVTGTPTAKVAANYAAVVAEGEAILSTALILDAERGGLTIDSADNLSNKYVSVTYNAGFAVDGSDDELYDADDVPEWLKKAAILYASASLLRTNPDLQGADGQVKRDPKELHSSAERIARGHVRYFPSPIRPI